MEKTDLNNPVSVIEDFFGREALASKIYSRIGAGRPQSVSIVGDYKIGKTSLLNYLLDPQTQKKYLGSPASYIFIFISVSDNSITSLEQFVNILTAQLAEKTHMAAESQINHYDWFKKSAEKMTQEGRKIIIFMDDFNLITQNDNFPLEFFSFLRSMANNYNIAYVTTSYHDLQKLCVSKDVEESPFFNIFTNMTLRALDEQDVPALIENELDKASLQHAELLEKYAGRFPYQLKVACRTLRDLNVPETENSFEDTFSRDFYDEIKEYYSTLFDRLDSEHQKILRQFVATGRVPDNLHYLFNDLERKDYAYQNGKKAGLYSPSFERFIREKFNLTYNNNKSNTSVFSRILSWFK